MAPTLRSAKANLAAKIEMNSHINDLPPEMLSTIFRYLKKTSDRSSAGRVCHLWRSVIMTTIGASNVMIGNGNEFLGIPSSCIPWRKLDEITKIGISDCVFSNVIVGPSDNLEKTLSVTFLLPNLLQKIQFYGVICQTIFQNVCSPLRHLTTLIFHASTFTLLPINLARENVNLCQSLRTFCLSSEGFGKTHFRTHDMELLFENVISLCSSYFPRLKKFALTLPIFLDKEIQVYTEITKFFDRHHTTMEEVDLKFTDKWRVDSKTSTRRTELELMEVIGALPGLEHELAGMVDPSSWNLKSIIFVIEDFGIVIPTAVGVREAALLQTRLETLYYMCWNFIPVPVNLIRTNSATLTDIGLTVDDITQPIDCTDFAECVNLRRLVLQTDGEIVFDDLANQAPRLQNVTRLPTSLRCLRLRNTYIEAQSVEWIAKNLPNLSTLILVNIGRLDNLGISIPCLLWILRESPTMKFLKVKGINNCCHLATFGFHDLPNLRMTCPVCKVRHYQNHEKEVQGEKEPGIIDSKERDFLSGLFSQTDHETKFIPLLKKADGVWSPSDETDEKI